MMTQQGFSFGRFRIAGPVGPLFRDDLVVPLPPKAAAVLWQLIREPGAVVTKDALLAAVWPDTFVTEGALSYQVQLVREALGDDARHPQFIATVHRVGFRFVASATAVGTPHFAPPSQDKIGITRDIFGREGQLEALKGAYAEALSGQPTLVLVTGEAGIGKSTLVQAFLAGSGDGWSATGQCAEHFGVGEPYLPFIEIVEQLGRHPEDGAWVVHTLRQVAPTWLAQLPALMPPDEYHELQAQAQYTTRPRMLREFAGAVDALAARAPLILVIEDLHWSDPSTLDLIALLGRRRSQARVLVVATLRDQDASGSNAATRLASLLLSERRAKKIHVSEITLDNIRQYLSSRCSEYDLTRWAETIFAKSEGHPLFMRELAVQGPAGSLDGLAIPDTLRALILDQLERRSADEVALLEAAAVGGGTWSVAVLGAALNADLTAVEERCDALVGHFFEAVPPTAPQREVPAGSFRFRHAIFQEVLYDRISPSRRARLHLAWADALELHFADRLEAHAAELATHYDRAHAWAQAERAHAVAAEQALSCGASQEAVRHLTAALEVLGRPGQEPRFSEEARLQVLLGEAWIATRGYVAPEVEQAFARARSICIVAAPNQALAPALWGLCMFHLIRADFLDTRSFATELIRISPPDRLRFAAELALAAIDLFTGSPDAALERLAPLLAAIGSGAEVASLHGQDVRVEALALAAWAALLGGRAHQAVAYSDRALDYADGRRCTVSLAVALYRDAVVRSLCGDHELALLRAHALTELAETYGLPHWQAAGRVVLGGERVWVHGDREGLQLIREASAERVAMGVGLGGTLDGLLWARAAAHLGDHAELGRAREAVRAEAERTGERLWLPWLARLEQEMRVE